MILPAPERGDLTESSPVWFGGTLTATTDAQNLPARNCLEVMVMADPDNAVDVFVGPAEAQPFQLQPGASLTVEVSSTSLVFVRSASSTAVVAWAARA